MATLAAQNARLLAALENWLKYLNPKENSYSNEETLLIEEMTDALAENPAQPANTGATDDTR